LLNYVGNTNVAPRIVDGVGARMGKRKGETE